MQLYVYMHKLTSTFLYVKFLNYYISIKIMQIYKLFNSYLKNKLSVFNVSFIWRKKQRNNDY